MCTCVVCVYVCCAYVCVCKGVDKDVEVGGLAVVRADMPTNYLSTTC